MLLFQKIEYIFLHVDFVDSNFDKLSAITRRMYVTGLANELNQLVSQLTVLDEQIETSLDFEDALIDLSIIENNGPGYNKLFNESHYREDANNDIEINKLIDIFPLNKENYSFTSTNAEKIKTGLRYLCSDANISSRDYVYAISNGLKNVCSLIINICRKKKNIKDYQYEEFWYTCLYRDDDFFSERAINDYDKWKEEHDCQDIQVLKDKRTQEILKLLGSGVFNYDAEPVRREMDQSIIDISEDALEEGMEIPEGIKKESARFSKYVYFKDDILCLDYTKLGRYVYRHYGDLKEVQVNGLIYFDYILLHIHDDMAECNPNLKKHLRFYEDNLLEDVLNKSLEVIETCNSLLKEDVDKDFLTLYLREAFSGDNKIEVQAKLKGQSKYTLICNMLGMIKTTKKVFTLDTTSQDLAKALSSIVQKPKEDSLKRYIDEGASDYKSKLSKWTTQYVMEKLGTDKERLFLKVVQK